MKDPYLILLIICAILTLTSVCIRIFFLENKRTVWKNIFTSLFALSLVGGLYFTGVVIQNKKAVQAKPNGDQCEQRIDELKIFAQKATVTVINSGEQPIRYVEVSSVYFKNQILELPSKRGYRLRLPYGNDEPAPKITVRYNEKEAVFDLQKCNPSFGPMPIDTDP